MNEALLKPLRAASAAIWVAILIEAVQFAFGASAYAGALDTIRAAQAIRIAYREDAPPFSYKDAKTGQPAGFIVELCQVVAKELAEQLGLQSLKIVYVPVTGATRFAAIEKNDADLLCGPTTATLDRRKHVDFSVSTFVDGASLMTNDASLHAIHDFGGRKVGVLAGTTTEQTLGKLLKQHGVAAEVTLTKTHDEGVGMLESGEISAYFADHAILIFLRNTVAKDPAKLHLAADYLTIEPYALALPHGDEDFRLAVDTALSHVFRTSEITNLFNKSFGDGNESDLIQALYLVAGLPD